MVSIKVPKYISVKFTQTALCQINSNWLLKTHSFLGKRLLCNSGCAELLICFKHTSVFNNQYLPPIIWLKNVYGVSKEEIWLIGCHLQCRNMPRNMGLSLFSCSVMSDSLWPHGLQNARLSCPSPSPGVCSIHVHWVCDVIQSSHPLSSPSPPALNLSQHQGLFQGVHASVRWPKYQSFNFSISTSSEYSELISFRIDWFEEVKSSQSLVGCQG